MSRIAGIFEARAASGRRTLVTYLVAGDPAPEVTVPAMHALVRGGADVIELGLPFSDPEAEGPVIQLGHERALAHGVRLRDVLDMVRRFREDDADTAIVLMGYLNPVERMGYAVFAEAAADAGVDGLILVNLPPEEAGALRRELTERSLDLILLLAPTTTDARAREILASSSGFAYYVSLKGITGAGNLDVDAVAARLGTLRPLTELPFAVGFGIKDGPSAQAVSRVADGVVVGSAIVALMGEHRDRTASLPEVLADFTGELRGAMDAAAG